MVTVLICHQQHCPRRHLLSRWTSEILHSDWSPPLSRVSWRYIIPCLVPTLLVHVFVSSPFNATLECKQCTSQRVVHDASSLLGGLLARWLSRLSDLRLSHISFASPCHFWDFFQHLGPPRYIPSSKPPALTFFISISPYYIYILFFLQLHGNNINTWRHWKV